MKRIVMGLLLRFVVLSAIALSFVTHSSSEPVSYYSQCSSRQGMHLCLWDGHLSNGRVKISATLKNTSRTTSYIAQFTLTSPYHWVIQIVPYGENTPVRPGQTLLGSKTLSVTSWHGDVRTAWGAYLGGFVTWGDGIDTTRTW